MARYRSGRVEIDVRDVLDEIEDEYLIEECNRRKLSLHAPNEADPEELLKEAWEELSRGRAIEARLILERLLFPKFKSEVEALKKFEEARKSA